jgi:hypothetical protein
MPLELNRIFSNYKIHETALSSNPKPLLSKAEYLKFEPQQFMGLEITASRSPWTASRPYQISWKSIK